MGDRDAHPGAQILICEGSHDVLTTLSQDLSRAGYRVLQARTAKGMMQILADGQPDLILCNTDLPGVDGMALLHRIRHTYPELDGVPVLMLSVHSDPSDIAAGKSAGADDYLTLPVDPDMLVATVAAQLRQSARTRSACAAAQVPAPDLAGFDHVAAYENLLNRFSFGIVLVNGAGSTVFMNDTARRMTGRDPRTIRNWLIRRAGLAEIGTRTSGRRTGQQGPHLSALLGAEADEIQGSLLVTAQRLSADRMADPATAVLLYSPSGTEDHRVRLVADAVGLTPAETTVAQLLSQGRRIEEITRSLSVSRPTVNFHLQNIFRKTATSRQADLVALLNCVQLHA